ncbi:MAG: hypothetical protein WCJ29_00635 [bacterium]
MKSSCVVISTFKPNECFYLKQLKSIRSQNKIVSSVYVRDDSCENVAVTDDCSLGEPRPVSIKDNFGNLGPAKSFLELLRAVPDDFDYYAFCDQDDIWESDKLECAEAALRDINQPALFASRLTLIDENDKIIGHSKIPKLLSFENALVENTMPGCSMVLNRAARELILKSKPDHVAMHDSWCYLIVSAFGKIIYDQKPLVRYRQHGNNAIGMASGNIGRLKRRIARIIKGERKFFVGMSQALEFEKYYGLNLSPEKAKILTVFINSKKSFWSRLAYAFSAKVQRESFFDNILLRVLFILGEY